MSRTPAKVTQADVARVARVARDLGLGWRVRVTPEGEIVLEQGEPVGNPTPQTPVAATRDFRL